jgi:hypothetical protein
MGMFDRAATVDDLVVFVLCEAIGIPLCIGGGDGVVNGHLWPSVIGFGLGLPLSIAGVTYHWWKTSVSESVRRWVQQAANLWWPAALAVAFIYVCGPSLVSRLRVALFSRPNPSQYDQLIAAAVGALVVLLLALMLTAISVTVRGRRLAKAAQGTAPLNDPQVAELRLSVGRIAVAFERLKDAVYIQFEIVVFPCPRGLKFESLSGKVYYKQLSISAGMQKPIEEETLGVPHLEEFANLGLQGTSIMLHQYVSRALADKILQALVLPDVRLEFHFHELDIMVSSASVPDPQRLPLWDGVGCQHGIAVYPIVKMTLSDSLHADARFGSAADHK